MTYLFNTMVEQEEFPTFWKLFKEVGLYKGGDREDSNNYRPIALLSPLLKLIEMELLSCGFSKGKPALCIVLYLNRNFLHIYLFNKFNKPNLTVLFKILQC